MPAERIAMHKIRELLRLKYDCALSHERIARALSISKGVVAKYVKAAEASGRAWAELSAADEAQLRGWLGGTMRPRGATAGYVPPDLAAVHQGLKKKSVTLALLWEEYVQAAAGPAYQYSRFCDLYREFARHLKRSMRQVHRAGEKLFIDYAGDTVPIVDADTGEISRAQIFVAVLGASSYTFACATATQSQADWLGSLARALAFIGGVPELVVPDNTRSLVGQADRYEPQLQRTTAEFAAHYGVAILPARPYKPQDKSKVEVGVQIVQRWILARLRHQRFFSLGELNEAIAALLEPLNTRAFRRLPGSRHEAFETLDRPALRALPATPFQFAQWKRAKPNIDYHVEFDGHYYSVPYALAGQAVELRITASSIECLAGGRRVAVHARSHRHGAFTTLTEHMPASHQAHRQWSPGKLIAWGATVGPHTEQVVSHQLERMPHPEQGYRACLGLMRLGRQYGNERLEAAATRAVTLGAMRYRSVASILKSGLDRAPLPTPTAASQTELALPAVHENLRGARYYH
ncbi:transposase [Aromatoleum aromaticum EbN1]|uniref:Transposase n=1 Tax=Aromatoleum aromaticum (strain DSM 19018 / LMG 30748 / EbN1) TaxID=76114 RepID=Q5P5W2_AROAE|nr:IS21 family transposase [Aromatoleum aromaticum]CAI07299.1 transposase [Aromatoleum aromaticum EbN1]CAI07526.1 transposase [Aromatoleum aromaticum EbN1]